VLLALMLCVAPAVASAQKLLFVVRHAERADAGAAAGQMQAQTDPALSAVGAARAARLATMLADAGVTAIYATEYRRTKDTAGPLAAKVGVAVQSMGAREQDALIQKLKSSHADDVVLLVGHSNTVPAIIKAFGGPEFTMGEDEYDSLFIVVPATGTMTRIRY
jgi:broad specificity phosphatase PhoE